MVVVIGVEEGGGDVNGRQPTINFGSLFFGLLNGSSEGSIN